MTPDGSEWLPLHAVAGHRPSPAPAQSNAYLNGQLLSFRVTAGDGRTLSARPSRAGDPEFTERITRYSTLIN
ncbi:hypothetical protein GUJ93_ZPchr0013g35551 [Zizania palustris]|uniref:Uncharacterized protein n=1 Tax=Zizania palustris TaxID=103762 RepID=A0A8J6BUS9_ZIZPA|nr:hypothetical protein GUJ93_ZPchr0013g35551 [Zizania palustris]